MTTISVNDVTKADLFLSTYLKNKIPEADFSEGSALRDFVIKAIAYIFAYMETERTLIKDRQSLLTLSKLPDDESVSDAVDALLSNWFITRKNGTQSIVSATLHFSKKVDIVINPTIRFNRTDTVSFFPLNTSTQIIPSSALKPIVRVDGTIIDYVYSIPLVAEKVGSTYNIKSGRFISVDVFSPYFLYAENQNDSSQGNDIESTSALLERASTAISVRNLINQRSIETVLKDKFPNVTNVLAIGFGDVEMTRDLSGSTIPNFNAHLGGCVDIYVTLPKTNITESLTVGSSFERPDNVINILKDSAGFDGIVPGNILRVLAGLTDAPREYVITRVTRDEIEVSSRTPFIEATDIERRFVSYTIGTFSPGFDNLISERTTGETSTKIKKSGAVVLKGCSQYRINDINIVTEEGLIELGPRTNIEQTDLQYQVLSLNPGDNPSGRTVTLIKVDPIYDGKVLRINYDTVIGYDEIETYVTDTFERIVVSNPLVKTPHQVYLQMDIGYRLNTSIRTLPNELDIKQTLATYINNFNAINPLTISNLMQVMLTTYPDIVVSPFIIKYDLYAPDGQIYSYETTDIVTIVPTSNDGVTLTNGNALRSEIINTLSSNETLKAESLREVRKQLTNLGISVRIVQYNCNISDISLTQQI